MNQLDPRPSLGACNAAAGLGLAASNWQRAPRPPVRMATAPLISPSAAHHTLPPLGTPAAQPAARPAAGLGPALAGRGNPAPLLGAAPPSTATSTQAVRVSVRGPGAAPNGRSTTQATTWLAAEPPAPWAVRSERVHAAPQGELPPRAAQPAAGRAPRGRAGSREVVFEFIGQGALSVLSSITGRCYRFEQPGARLIVDHRDVGQLARVSLLRCLETA